MTHQDSYKIRSQNVRQSARAHLLEMRQARLQKRVKIMAPSEADLPAAAQPDVAAPAADAKPAVKKKRKSTKKAAKVKTTDVQVMDTAAPGPDDAAQPSRAQSDADLADALDDVAAKNAGIEYTLAEDSAALPPEDDTAAQDPAPDAQLQEPEAALPPEGIEEDPSLDTDPPAQALADETAAQALPEETHQDEPALDAAQEEVVCEDIPSDEAQHDDSSDGTLAEEMPTDKVPHDAASDETALDDPKTAMSDGGQEVPKVAASDLNKLPGAGHGLIWMLEQCGITSLQDLADSDAETLTPQLGIVGQILNVESWIAFAQDEVAAAA